MDFAKICSVMPSEYDRPERLEIQTQQECRWERCRTASEKKMPESEALRLAVGRFERRGGYSFPASRVRGVNPNSFTTEDIMRFTDDELHDYIISCKLLDAAKFMCDVTPDPE